MNFDGTTYAHVHFGGANSAHFQIRKIVFDSRLLYNDSYSINALKRPITKSLTTASTSPGLSTLFTAMYHAC